MKNYKMRVYKRESSFIGNMLADSVIVLGIVVFAIAFFRLFVA